MTALLLVLMLFAGFWLVGLGVLAGARADLRSLRVTLVAPVLGSGTFALVLFLFSLAGVGIAHCAVPVAVVLLAGAAVVLAIRRPSVDPRALLVVAVCLGGLALVAGPLVSYGFRWDSAGNDDMGNYVLSATSLLRRGLLAPFDIQGLLHDRDYASFLQAIQHGGGRPGADIELAGVSGISGRLPYEVFMPLILAMQLSGACATGALAMQAARRWWAAPVAAAVILISPEANYGWLHQLIAQVAGLGLAAAVLAILMDPELHAGARRPTRGDLVPLGLLTAAFVLSYVELASTIALAYVLYAATAFARRRTTVGAVARIALPAVAVTAVLLNGYLLREITYVAGQARGGLSGPGPAGSAFAYSLVPDALAQLTGLTAIPGVGGVFTTNTAIILSAILVGALLLGATVNTMRGSAAATVLAIDILLAAVLAYNGSDFGLFKLYMYVQPFVAAMLASWMTRIVRPQLLALAAAALGAILAIQLPVLGIYVDSSRDPIALAHASDPSLLPAFRRFLATSAAPLVSVTENPTLAKLEASTAVDRPIYFISASLFGNLTAAAGVSARDRASVAAATAWTPRLFKLLTRGPVAVDPFAENVLASRVIAAGRCQIVLPSGSELAINRATLPEGAPALVRERCAAARDQLVFTFSSLGQGYFTFAPFPLKSLWQIEPDPYQPGHTFSGVGRFLLFRVLGPVAGSRLRLDLTTTLLHDAVNALPPAAAVGATRVPLGLEGNGSARVYSAPLRPQIIAGQPYLLLDLGRNGQLIRYPRTGIQGLWASNAHVDPRYLVGWMRDVSLVSPAAYRSLRPPREISTFPQDLANPNLQYSGIYEDGWVGEDSFVVLAGGAAGELEVRAAVPPGAARHLVVLVNGHRVYSAAVASGALDVRVRVPATSDPRRIDLQFTGTIHLGTPDLRPVSAALSFLGLVPGTPAG